MYSSAALKDMAEVAHEEHEGEEGSAEKRVRGYFAEDIAGENAHAEVRALR